MKTALGISLAALMASTTPMSHAKGHSEQHAEQHAKQSNCAHGHHADAGGRMAHLANLSPNELAERDQKRQQHLTEALELTAAQQQAMQRYQDSQLSKKTELLSRLKALHGQMDMRSNDAGQRRETAGKIKTVKDELRQMHQAHQDMLQSILTDEQKLSLAKLKDERHRHEGGKPFRHRAG